MKNFRLLTVIKKKNVKKKPGFTLAEVLIVIGIVGIVAEMTIPTVIQNASDQASVIALKKNYSVIQQAITTAVANEGPIDTWYTGADATEGNVAVNNIFAKYMRTIKVCGSGSPCNTATYKFLSSRVPGYMDFTSSIGLVLADGTIMIPSIDLSSYGLLISFFVDVNGIKAPNQVGVDLFGFAVYGQSRAASLGYNEGILYPNSGMNTGDLRFSCSKNVTFFGPGMGFWCTNWAINVGNLDYKYVDDLNWETKTHK